MTQNDQLSVATFAGGCFWCMEPPFARLDGVISVTAGYTGGEVKNPSYEQVCTGRTGHTEAVQVVFDPSKIGYEELLEVFWRNINPADPDGQFVDRGTQYRPCIFYHDESQKSAAEASRDRLEQSGRFSAPIRIEISPLRDFYPAEDHHQGYYRKNPVRYQAYHYNSGRGQFLDKFWEDERK